jgi:hypothetical protein
VPNGCRFFFAACGLQSLPEAAIPGRFTSAPSGTAIASEAASKRRALATFPGDEGGGPTLAGWVHAPFASHTSSAQLFKSSAHAVTRGAAASAGHAPLAPNGGRDDGVFEPRW